jgi:hypothetical protein
MGCNGFSDNNQADDGCDGETSSCDLEGCCVDHRDEVICNSKQLMRYLKLWPRKNNVILHCLTLETRSRPSLTMIKKSVTTHSRPRKNHIVTNLFIGSTRVGILMWFWYNIFKSEGWRKGTCNNLTAPKT